MGSVWFYSLLKTFKYLMIWVCRDKYFSSVTQLTGSDINLISRSCYHNEAQRKFNQDNFLYAHSLKTLSLSFSLSLSLSLSLLLHNQLTEYSGYLFYQSANPVTGVKLWICPPPCCCQRHSSAKSSQPPPRHSTKFTASSSHRAAQLSSSESTRHHSQRSSDSFFTRSPSPSVLMRPDRQRLIFSLLEPNQSTCDSRGPD